MDHSNLARTATGTGSGDVNYNTRLLLDLLSNPTVVNDLNREGYVINWSEVFKIITERDIITKKPIVF